MVRASVMLAGRATNLSVHSPYSHDLDRHTGRSREQLAQENLDRIKPVQRLGIRAMRDALIGIALAEIPQPDLVEIVQPNGPGDTVDQDGVGDGHGDDMGQVEAHEVGLAHNRLVGYIANTDEQQKDPGEKVEQRANQLVPKDSGLLPPGARRMLLVGGFAEEGHES